MCTSVRLYGIFKGNSFSRSLALSVDVFLLSPFSVLFLSLILFHFSWDLLVNVLISFSAFAIFYSIHGCIYYSFWLTLTLIDVAAVSCAAPAAALLFSLHLILSLSLSLLMCCTLLLFLLLLRWCRRRCRHCFCRLFFFCSVFFILFFTLLRYFAYISLHSPSDENREMYILKLLRTRADMEYIDMTFSFSFIRTQQNRTERASKWERERENKCILYQMSILIRTICLLGYFPTKVSWANQKNESEREYGELSAQSEHVYV